MNEHTSYDPAYFKALFAIEDRHFWFRSRNRIIAAMTNQVVAHMNDGYRVLEVGSGTGNTLRVLENVCDHGKVVGVDLFAEGLYYARQRVSCPLVQGDMSALPFGTQFELIGIFDVLEHLPDDIPVLRHLRRMLAPGGALLITVPAHQSLWSYFDVGSHHCRRYGLPELRGKLTYAGFRIEYITEYMTILLPLVWLGRRLASAITLHRSNGTTRSHELACRELHITPVLNDIAKLILYWESWAVRRRKPLPFGISLLAVARDRVGGQQKGVVSSQTRVV